MWIYEAERAGPQQGCPVVVAIAAAKRAPRRPAPLSRRRHFDIYDGPGHEAVIADQLAFLERHVLTREERRQT